MARLKHRLCMDLAGLSCPLRVPRHLRLPRPDPPGGVRARAVLTLPSMCRVKTYMHMLLLTPQLSLHPIVQLDRPGVLALLLVSRLCGGSVGAFAGTRRVARSCDDSGTRASQGAVYCGGRWELV